MKHDLPHSAPCVGMRLGDRLRPAVPVHLDGHFASVVLEGEDFPRVGRTRLHLDWYDGRVTELEVEMRSLDIPAQVAHMDIRRVEGDWRPFLEYLAAAAA